MSGGSLSPTEIPEEPYNLTPRLRREIREIVFDHFEYIREQWNEHEKRKRDAGDSTHSGNEYPADRIRFVDRASGADSELSLGRLFQTVRLSQLGSTPHAEVSPGSYGIHWPLIDEDLSISGLIRNAESNS